MSFARIRINRLFLFAPDGAAGGSAPPPPADPPPTPPADPPEGAGDQDFTPEWKQSVEDRFAQIGDALKAFSTRRSSSGGHPAAARSTQPTQPGSAPSAGAAGAGQASGTPQGAAGAGTPPPGPSGDSRPPKPTHWWYRKFGE